MGLAPNSPPDGHAGGWVRNVLSGWGLADVFLRLAGAIGLKMLSAIGLGVVYASFGCLKGACPGA